VTIVRKVLPALRYSWSAGPLVLAAAVLLILGATGRGSASTALVGAGSALAGAAAARLVDLDRERRADQRQASNSRKQDLDETRRLGYMALMAKGTRTYELAATLANALAHHQQVADIREALGHLLTLANGGPGTTDASEAWLSAQLDRITQTLDDAG
jgi:hypothetical protein